VKQPFQTSGRSFSRIILPALLMAIAAFCVVVAGVEQVLPQQSTVGTGRDYGYVCSGAKSESTDFSLAADTKNSMLVFGSSELSTPARLIPEVPSVVFGLHSTDVHLNYIGEAYDQSLWQAIAAGAYGGKTNNRKVVLLVSPSWFENGGLANETFKLRFSYNLYREFCANPAISTASKDYLAQRLSEQGIDSMTIHAGLKDLPYDRLNDATLGAMDDLKLRSELCEVRSYGIDKSDVSSSGIDFAALRKQALADAKAGSSNNDWGYDNAFYTENIKGREGLLKNTQAKETFTKTSEFDDLTFFLKVCKEVGFEPLVVIEPVSGKFYDLTGVSKQTRKRLYQRIRDICTQSQVKYADFSNREYERYFLHDIAHFGWKGWVDVEEAIYDYANSK
jgi:D-alanine transfer protein